MTAPLTWSLHEPAAKTAMDSAIVRAILRLAARPWSLFFFLLALNAVARPYAGISHDAWLYSVQVLNQLDPAVYGDDLFFRYGSQDQFSIFSRVMAPLVSLLGLHTAFFLVYFVFNGLLILALKRLIETLIDDRLVSTLALVFMMVAPLSFGGLKTLHVQEPFLTPRLPANVFVLFALERTLRGRFVSALALLCAGMVFHPLMAIGGLLIWIGCLAWQMVGARALLALTLLAASAGVWFLATPSLALRFFGLMDASWQQVILRASPFNFPSEWAVLDWVNVGMGLLGVGAAAVICSGEKDSARSKFFLILEND